MASYSYVKLDSCSYSYRVYVRIAMYVASFLAIRSYNMRMHSYVSSYVYTVYYTIINELFIYNIYIATYSFL